MDKDYSKMAKEQLLNELVQAVYAVCTAPLGNSLLKANQTLPIVSKAVLDRMK